MQVILTEEEYLKLKNQNDEHKNTYVKRIDVVMAFKDFTKNLTDELSYDMNFASLRSDVFKKLIQNFIDSIG